MGNTKVIPKGEDVILTGEVWNDITQTAANIELHSKVKDKDHRVFLDGVYVYEKKKGIDK
jgi:large subunit ribosomal protein L6